jgi:KUP system potassium uptake protein
MPYPDTALAQGSADENGSAADDAHDLKKQGLAALTLGAIGVVYGDIGTSPLYAMREALRPVAHDGLERTEVLGVISLLVWTLVLIVTIKYVLFLLRADNRGEGGILALVALLIPQGQPVAGRSRQLALLGLFGAALLYGDSMLTPAISVLSAVEGLEVATPAFARTVVPLTVLVLVGLFAIQRHGTGRMGALFGPVTLVWFATLGTLGVRGIAREPAVLEAVNPWHAMSFFAHNGFEGFLVLAAAFLVVTGAEALYADMGHFGRRPIRLSWFTVVLPGLMLNYFGQGALLLQDPDAASNPFYRLAPAWALYPLVALATAATVIASQAVISGAFSLTHQAIALGYSPRLPISHTSARESGQIYVAPMNWLLMLASCALVVGFGSSTNLAAAYGLAVTADMVLTSLLLCAVAHQRWGWRLGVVAYALAFLPLELSFFGSNLFKIAHGGWFSLAVAGVGFALMSTWKRGRLVLQERLEETALPVDLFLPDLETHRLPRVARTAVFMTGDPTGTPLALLHNIKHNQVVHERTLFLTLLTAGVPYVSDAERLTVKSLGQGFYRIIARYGFMEVPNVPGILAQLRARHGLEIDPATTTYFVGREKLIPSGRSGMARWREVLFAFMSQNSHSATTYFRIPPGQVVELGAQVPL